MNDRNLNKKDGRESAAGLARESREEERRVEKQKGSDLRKGAERLEERAASSDRRGTT